MIKRLPLKISVSGLRGVVGDSLTPQLVSRFAQAFGTYLGPGKIVVGQDARSSGPMLKNAVFSGLLSVGCQPVDIGICPIPSFLVFTKETRASGGIAVTASHNPPEWNGLKFISGKGLFLNHSQVKEFLDIYHQGEFDFVEASKCKPLTAETNPTAPHLKKLLSVLDVQTIRRKRFRVVADCCTGAGGVLIEKFLRALGCEPILINAALNGNQAHHSDAVPENLKMLTEAIKKENANAGFIQDADADRLAVLDEKGTALGEELTLALASRHVLLKTPGPVVTNLSTTQAIDDIAAHFGVPVLRTKIGEIHVVEGIIQNKAAIGGEGNGGVIWPEVHLCRDSFTAMGLILESLALSGKPLSELRREIPAYFMIKDKIDGTPEQAHRILGKIKKDFLKKGSLSTLDGLKITFPEGWVHIRASNTEPIIRIVAEAKTRKKAGEILEIFKNKIKGMV